MLPDSTQQLILKLWDLTTRGVIPWSHGEDGDLQFKTEGYVVAIRDEPARVRIVRSDGHTVEEANAAALAATGWPHPELSRYEDAIHELANRAASLTNGKARPARPALSAFSAPARTPSARARQPTFGAIQSFDVSAPRRVTEVSSIEAPAANPAQPQAPTKNVYSPWIS